MKETMKMQMVNYRVMWVACALMVFGLTGCKQNTQVYESTENYPMSIDLVDVRSKEVIWTMDIPVRHKLELEFWHETGIATKWQPPTKVVYRLYPSSKMRKMTYESSLPLDIPVLIKMRKRPAPEYAMPGLINGQPIIYDDQQPVEPAPVVAPAAVEQPAAAEPAPEPAAVEPQAVEEEPAVVEQATIQPAEEPVPEAVEPEADAKQEEPTEVVEPAADPEPAVTEEPTAVEEPVKSEPAAEPEAIEEPAPAEPEPQKPKNEDKWALPTIDPAKKNDKDYPALDD